MKIKCDELDLSECADVIFAEFADESGIHYVSREIRFHTPAEHVIDGKRYDMEVQLLFTADTVGDLKRKAAVAFLIEEKAGISNAYLDIIDPLNLPNIAQSQTCLRSMNTNEGVDLINIGDIFKPRHESNCTG